MIDPADLPRPEDASAVQALRDRREGVRIQVEELISQHKRHREAVHSAQEKLSEAALGSNGEMQTANADLDAALADVSATRSRLRALLDTLAQLDAKLPGVMAEAAAGARPQWQEALDATKKATETARQEYRRRQGELAILEGEYTRRCVDAPQAVKVAIRPTDRPIAGVNVGEAGGFEPSKAAELVASGAAEYAEPWRAEAHRLLSATDL